MKRGFYLSITSVIILTIVVGFVLSANRSGSVERELSIEADRTHAMSTTLLRLRSNEMPNAVSVALKESVVALDATLSASALETMSGMGSVGSVSIDHPLVRMEARGSEFSNDPVTIMIDSFQITSIEPVPTNAFLMRVTYDLTVAVESEHVRGTFVYTDAVADVSIVGVRDPDHGSQITKTDYQSDPAQDCYLQKIGVVSDCQGQQGLSPRP